MRFVTTFNNQWSEVRNLLVKNWHILGSDSRSQPHLPDNPLLTARRAPNLGNYLTQSHFVGPCKTTGRGFKLVRSFPRGDCNVCQYMEPTKQFVNPRDGRTVGLKGYINCRTKGVIYCLKCPCSLLYIGQTTQQLKQRVQKHLSTINLATRDCSQQKKLITVAEHLKVKLMAAKSLVLNEGMEMEGEGILPHNCCVRNPDGYTRWIPWYHMA